MAATRLRRLHPDFPVLRFVRLIAGQLDVALVAGEPSYQAFMGIGRPATRLKILTAMYSSPGMFVVRADSPYRTIRDLEPA